MTFRAADTSAAVSSLVTASKIVRSSAGAGLDFLILQRADDFLGHHGGAAGGGAVGASFRRRAFGDLAGESSGRTPKSTARGPPISTAPAPPSNGRAGRRPPSRSLLGAELIALEGAGADEGGFSSRSRVARRRFSTASPSRSTTRVGGGPRCRGEVGRPSPRPAAGWWRAGFDGEVVIRPARGHRAQIGIGAGGAVVFQSPKGALILASIAAGSKSPMTMRVARSGR